MSLRTLVALLAGLLLFVAACDDDGAEPQEDGEDVGAELEDPPTDDQPEPVQLEDGVAGTVDDVEISDDEVQEASEELSRNPQIEAQLEQGQVTSELLPSIALEQAIQTLVLERGAADLGVEVDQSDIDAAEEDLVADMGGADEFEDQLDQAGFSEEDLQETLRLEALINGVQAELDVDEDAADDEGAPMGPDGQPVEPADVAFQEWFFEQVRGADIAVDEEYGVWIAEQGTLMPPEEHMPEPPPMDLPEELEDMDPEELEELLDEMGG